MNIKCCICHELFVPSDDVFFTPCGHFFHYPCLSHWLERSKSCPHCRNKVTEKSIHRAYFDFSNADDVKVDTNVLTNRIDSLEYQILLKDQDLKICGEDNASLKAQAAGLRAEVRKLESEIDQHRSAIHALKKQAKCIKELTSDADAAKREVARLKNTLQEYRKVQTLISNSQDEVERMLSETQDRTALATYVSVMKREMESNVQRRRELRERIRKLESEMVEVKSERDDLLQLAAECRQLEEDFAHCKNEKQSLWNKLQKLESQLTSNGKTTSEDIQRFIAESPAPERVKALREHESLKIADCNTTFPETASELEPEIETLEPSPELKSNKKSPYLSVKNQGAGYSTLSQRSARLRPSSSCLSILARKPRLTAPSKAGQESTEMHYDGFGGHSKVDDYPSPIIRFKSKMLKTNMMSMKVKRRKLPDGSTKKLDDFLIDLT